MPYPPGFPFGEADDPPLQRWILRAVLALVERLEQAGIEVVTPDKSQKAVVHRVIYEELCRGKVCPSSRKAYLDIVASLAYQGAQGVILGCTEIGLLIGQADTPIALYDTTKIHAAIAVDRTLEGI